MFAENAVYVGTQVFENIQDAENLVGLSGLEPPTSRLSGVRSNRLSYRPISVVKCFSSLKSFSLYSCLNVQCTLKNEQRQFLVDLLV